MFSWHSCAESGRLVKSDDIPAKKLHAILNQF